MDIMNSEYIVLIILTFTDWITRYNVKPLLVSRIWKDFYYFHIFIVLFCKIVLIYKMAKNEIQRNKQSKPFDYKSKNNN